MNKKINWRCVIFFYTDKSLVGQWIFNHRAIICHNPNELYALFEQLGKDHYSTLDDKKLDASKYIELFHSTDKVYVYGGKAKSGIHYIDVTDIQDTRLFSKCADYSYLMQQMKLYNLNKITVSEIESSVPRLDETGTDEHEDMTR